MVVCERVGISFQYFVQTCKQILYICTSKLFPVNRIPSVCMISKLRKSIQHNRFWNMIFQLCPWIESDAVKIDTLYTELKIGKLEHNPAGKQIGEVSEDYTKLFKGSLIIDVTSF